MNNDFFKAITDGDSPKVEQMIYLSPDLVNSRNESGMSAVTIAVYYGRPEIAKLLVSKEAKLDIFDASIVGNLVAAKKFIEKDEKIVNSYSSDGFTPLHLAAFFGHYEVASLLITSGADINAVAKNSMKVTPLHSAAARNQFEISKLLVSKGANVNAKQQQDFTPLHAAAMNGNSDLATFLLSKGAYVNARTTDGSTALGLIENEGREAGRKQDRENVAKILIQNGGKK